MTNKPSLDALLKLLNDEDEFARAAIIQLIQHYSPELEHILAQLQECDSEMLRKRSHQIQALLNFRQRRKNLHEILCLKKRDFRMYNALADLHMLWFEKDSSAEIDDLYNTLLAEFPTSTATMPFAVTEFLKKKQFAPLEDSSSNSDFCMLGNVFDRLSGSNSFLCALVLAIQQDLDLPEKLEVIFFNNRFLLYHRASNMICDVMEYWQTGRLNFSGYKTFNSNELLRYICALCFCNTVHDDAFRYTHIFADILLPDHDKSVLPYPYCGKE